MNRPMFAGDMQGTPVPPSSVGVGITSGLETPPVEQEMSKMASGVENMLSDIDNAKDTEGIINAMRGNEASIEERYNELASYVGEEDASKTPETVLTLVQPTFSLMDMAKQSAPMGGIADVNITEASPMSSPGMDEAVNRMIQGEQPVFRQTGSPSTGEEINKNPYLIANQFPQFQTIQPNDIRSISNYILDMQDPQFNLLRENIAKQNPQQKLEEYSPYLTQPKTTDEILKEYQNLLGTGDKTDSAVQAYLALAKAGADIGTSSKGLVPSIFDAGKEAIPTLSKIASDQTEKDRQLKLASYQESTKLAQKRKDEELGIITSTIETKESLENDLAKSKLESMQKAIDQGMQLTKDNIEIINNARKEAWVANNQYGQEPTETWAKLIKREDGTEFVDLIPVRNTDAGPKYFEDDKLVPIPEGYAPYTQGEYGDKKPDLGKFKSTKLLVPITSDMAEAGVMDNGSGMIEVAGFYTDKGGYYISTEGGDLQLAPEGFLLGQMSDVLKIADADAAGRVRVTNRLTGQSWISRVINPDTGEETRIGPVLKNLDNRARYEEIPQNDGSVVRKLISGDPFVRQVPNDSEKIKDYLAPGEISNTARRINESNKLLSMYDEYKRAAMEAVGWKGTLKQWSNAIIAPFWNIPEVKFHATEAAKVRLIQLGRQLVKSTALSERYAVAEQQLIEQKLGQQDADFWKNPELAATKIDEIMREVENFRNLDMAMLNGDKVVYQRDRRPKGTIKDPFIFSMKNSDGQAFHYDAFMNTVNAIGKGNENLYKNGYDKLYIYLTQEEAEARGIKAPEDGITINAKRLLGK